MSIEREGLDPNSVEALLRKKFDYHPVPAHPDPERAMKELAHLLVFTHIPTLASNLVQFISPGMETLNLNTEEAVNRAKGMLNRGEIPPSAFTSTYEEIMARDFPRWFVLVVGLPGSGKSYLVRLIKASNPSKHGLPIAESKWEEHGLDAGRAAGNIKTERGKKVTPEELLRANEHHSKNTAEIFADAPCGIAELPLDASPLFNEEGEVLAPALGPEGEIINVVGHPRGLRMYIDLLQKKEDFSGFPPCKIDIVFMVGGIFIRNVLVYSREEYQKIDLTDPGALEKAGKIARLFGQSVPENLKELEIRQTEGATSGIVRSIEAEHVEMAVQLWLDPGFTLPPGVSRDLSEKEIRDLMREKPSVRDQVVASQLDYAFRSVKPHEDMSVNMLVVYNNPGPEELGLDLEGLYNHFTKTENLAAREDLMFALMQYYIQESDEE